VATTIYVYVPTVVIVDPVGAVSPDVLAKRTALQYQLYVAVPLLAPVLVFTKLTVTGPGPQMLVTEGVKDVFTCGQFA